MERPLQDRFARPLASLRLSLTENCNFNCLYCRPPLEPRQKAAPPPLPLEDLALLARAFVSVGVERVRLTGGEPLLRPGLEGLIGQLAGLEGVKDLSLTTNGWLLAKRAAGLKAAGLHRVTVSLDSLDGRVLSRLYGKPVRPEPILEGIQAAIEAGLGPVKVNCVVVRGVNDQGLEEMAAFFKGWEVQLRFIEYMDTGGHDGWRPEKVVAESEILARLDGALGLASRQPVRVPGPLCDGVANLYRYQDGGLVGVVASVSRPFCGGCSRARLDGLGRFYPCLFSGRGVALAAGADWRDEAALARRIGALWKNRDDRYSELRESQPPSGGPGLFLANRGPEGGLKGLEEPPKVAMHRIGG